VNEAQLTLDETNIHLKTTLRPEPFVDSVVSRLMLLQVEPAYGAPGRPEHRLGCFRVAADPLFGLGIVWAIDPSFDTS
jgi:hypothetical protein